MARAKGNDLAELFGYAPDDTSQQSIAQRATQHCPFCPGQCIKHSHPQKDKNKKAVVAVYGSCSVVNAKPTGKEEVIICAQRFYANNYAVLKDCVVDAVGQRCVFTVEEFQTAKQQQTLPDSYAVLFGQKSGTEVSLEKPGIIGLSLDWVFACIDQKTQLSSIIPCEVQSIDTTGNYHANWDAYIQRSSVIPDSKHGMNWANVWKRLIPQLILKGTIAKHSTLSTHGTYFVVPDRVYEQFEKIIGNLPPVDKPSAGVMTIMTYSLGDEVPQGQIRPLRRVRQLRVQLEDFAKAFGSGAQVVSLGPVLDRTVQDRMTDLLT